MRNHTWAFLLLAARFIPKDITSRSTCSSFDSRTILIIIGMQSVYVNMLFTAEERGVVEGKSKRLNSKRDSAEKPVVADLFSKSSFSAYKILIDVEEKSAKLAADYIHS